MDKHMINKEEELKDVNGGAKLEMSEDKMKKAAEAMLKAEKWHNAEALDILGGAKEV